jgi:hypothetical protein
VLNLSNKNIRLFLFMVISVSVLLLPFSDQIGLASPNCVQRYYLRVFSPYGTPMGQGWYNASTYAYASLDIGVVDYGIGARRVFTCWSADASGKNYSRSQPILMDRNKIAIANWKTQYWVTFRQSGLGSSASGAVVNINGTDKLLSQLPYSFWVDKCAQITYSYGNVTSSTSGERFILVNVTGPASPFTVAAPTCVTGNYKTQYLLTVLTNPSELSSQPTETPLGEPLTSNAWWYDAGTSVLLTAKQVDNYTLSFWDVDGTSQGDMVNPISVVMCAAHIATANYQIVPPPPTQTVGGYSYSLTRNAPASYMGVYATLVLLLGIVLGLAKHKAKQLSREHLTQTKVCLFCVRGDYCGGRGKT